MLWLIACANVAGLLLVRGSPVRGRLRCAGPWVLGGQDFSGNQ